jgi:hypothetical protein
MKFQDHLIGQRARPLLEALFLENLVCSLADVLSDDPRAAIVSD